MGYFSDLDIENQEKAARNASALVMDPDDMKRIKASTDVFLRRGLSGALDSLFTAGAKVALAASRLNRGLHGTMYAAPSVFIRDRETVVVTHHRPKPRTVPILSKHLKAAKEKEWPKGLKPVKWI